MSIWDYSNEDLDKINRRGEKTLVSHLGITITNITSDSLTGTMPVDERTIQPYQLLHGGASCVLAESLASIAANLVLKSDSRVAVGQHIEATHLRSVTSGLVTGIAKAVYLGRNSQTWRIEIYNEDKKLVCDSKLIVAVIDKK